MFLFLQITDQYMSYQFFRILERLMNDRLIEFINAIEQFYKYEFGFQKRKSTNMPSRSQLLLSFHEIEL